MVARFLKPIFVVLGLLLLSIGLGAGWIGGKLEQKTIRESSHPAEKTLTHKVAEGLSVQSGMLPGIELVRFESCRIEKQRKGGFSFGAFNILVIDQLRIALPPDSGEGRPGMPESTPEHAGNSASGLLQEEFRKLLSAYPHFSSLEINGLCVDEAGDGNRLKNILTAGKAVAGRNSTLSLSDCGFLADTGERIQSGKATLSLKPPFLITTEQGSYRIEGFSGKYGLMFTQLTGK